MKTKFFLLLGLLLQVIASNLNAQGCVAIRSYAGCGSVEAASAFLGKGEFMVGSNFRYFRSYRHFRGDEEEKNRVEEGTNVINKSGFLDFTLNYGISKRLYASATLPFVFHNRSSMYEHGGNPPSGLGERHSTSSSGLSDMRLGLGYWLFNPATATHFNYALGLGVKIPTGKYDYMDTFYNQGPDKDQDVEGVVDQSIQPGDGGWGLAVDLQGYHILSNHFSLSTTLYYLFGFAESNGVLIRNQPPGGTEFAVCDQYLARLGINYVTSVNGLSFYTGGRIEGIPSEDLIGGSNAYRRPGYAISVEPGLNYNTANFSFNFSVPVAVYRNRTQSYLDKVKTEETGKFTQGDAAFADYLINLGVAYRFNNHHSMHDVPVITVD